MNSSAPASVRLLQSSLTAFNDGDSATAIEYARQALLADPSNVAALGALGLFLHADRQYAAAASTFARLTADFPQESSYWMNLGTARRGEARFTEALAAFAQAAHRGEDSADFYYNIGLTHIDLQDFESARTALEQAAARAPGDAEIRYRLAYCCYQLVKLDEALAALEKWDDMSGLTPELMANIGLLLMQLGASDRAEPAIRRALANAGNDPLPLLGLIQLLERTNRLPEALELLPVLTSHPQANTLVPEVTLLRAQLAQRGGHHETARQLFTQLLAAARDPQSTHQLQFPLAKSLDALKRHDEAFQTLLDAHCSQLEYLRSTAPALAARGAPTMEITRYGCSADDVAAWQDEHAPPRADSPVFVVAFPRSGTTLLELTLDSHPLLASMDEQPFVQSALDDIVATGAVYPHSMARLTTAELDDIRAAYWARVHQKVTLEPGQRLVDKNPLNILRLPVIRRLFPNAPVILAIRHPCDVMLSCFMQHFVTPDFALLCGDLHSLAAGYRRTFDFWYAQKALLTPSALELRYETFARDFPTQIRRVIEFIGVPWNDAVLRPEHHAREKGFISTPSYSQVVEPVNSKAVGRWHAYEHHFADILPIVQPYLDRWHYEGLGSSNNR